MSPPAPSAEMGSGRWGRQPGCPTPVPPRPVPCPVLRPLWALPGPVSRTSGPIAACSRGGGRAVPRDTGEWGRGVPARPAGSGGSAGPVPAMGQAPSGAAVPAGSQPARTAPARCPPCRWLGREMWPVPGVDAVGTLVAREQQRGLAGLSHRDWLRATVCRSRPLDFLLDIPFKKVSLVVLAPSSLCCCILLSSLQFSVFIHIMVTFRAFLPHLLVSKPNLNTALGIGKV